jgi:hypothetical protein
MNQSLIESGIQKCGSEDFPKSPNLNGKSKLNSLGVGKEVRDGNEN